MGAILMRWLILTIAVWAAAAIVPGIEYEGWENLLIAALVLGVLNAFVRPLLIVLSFPFVIVTLGFFLVLINALLLWWTGLLVKGFHVSGFWPALGASLIISAVSLLMGRIGQSRRRIVSYTIVDDSHTPPRSPPPGKGPIIDV